ncbi:hypothetical protein ABZ829_27920 [Streptomyces xanthochromogenes]|uniref:hypothetical protein n=1 Tax=Streptomyces xanthochromogenes TaxID=67384 RepID=UPI00343D4952
MGDGTWSALDRDKALAYAAYQRTVCPSCGTRHEDWDHGLPGEEDAYVASVQRCVGCQVIADKQAELKDEPDTHGTKIALLPVAVHAARQLERDLKARRRSPRERDHPDTDD